MKYAILALILGLAVTSVNACPQKIVQQQVVAGYAQAVIAAPVFAQQVYAVPQAVIQSQAVVQQYAAPQAIVQQYAAPQAVVVQPQVVQRLVQPRVRTRSRTVQAIRSR